MKTIHRPRDMEMTQAPFASLAEFKTVLEQAKGRDEAAFVAATDHNNQLTKPPGALGRLEELAIWYASWRGQAMPVIDAPQVVVFAGNHGVASKGVSAFPAEVTEQMVGNFAAGGAAINQLCKTVGASLDVVALELDRPTNDFTQGPAMSETDVVNALKAGWEAVDPKADLFVSGEMGIGNTTSAAAICAALYGGSVIDWVGRGTGVDETGLARKVEVITHGLVVNSAEIKDPLEALRCLGGRELAAMAGAIAAARFHRIPTIIDGFICSAAASTLSVAVPGALDHCVAAHQSAESAHARLLGSIEKQAILCLGMRLGEGSGGALAIGIMKAAVACHSGMATFAQAGVSDS